MTTLGTPPEHRFAEAVARYCRWAEDLPAPALDAVIARRLLAELYALALTLPDGTAESSVDAPRIDADAWRRIYERFKTLPIGYYGSVFDPLLVPPEEPGIGDACDDLADIYRDLRVGLDLYHQGLISHAVWEWRFHFEIHWGTHALACLQALHAYDPCVRASDAA